MRIKYRNDAIGISIDRPTVNGKSTGVTFTEQVAAEFFVRLGIAAQKAATKINEAGVLDFGQVDAAAVIDAATANRTDV